jgi:hypothetical protein
MICMQSGAAHSQMNGNRSIGGSYSSALARILSFASRKIALFFAIRSCTLSATRRAFARRGYA